MIGKHEKAIISVIVVILCVLFLLSSTNILLKEQESKIYRISVILDDVTDGNYTMMRRGLDQAGMEFNVDLNVITLYDKNNANQQLDFIASEAEDGAGAVILVPGNNRKLVDGLYNSTLSVPIIALQEQVLSERIKANLVSDNYEMGRVLGEEIIKDGHSLVVAFGDSMEKNRISQRYQGLQTALEAQQIPCEMVAGDNRIKLRTYLNSYRTSGAPVAVAALDESSMNLLMEVLAEDEFSRMDVTVYGIGYTYQILGQLENQRIQALVVENQYLLGYNAIATAVDIIEGLYPETMAPPDIRVINKDNMFDSDNAKLLFPI